MPDQPPLYHAHYFPENLLIPVGVVALAFLGVFLYWLFTEFLKEEK